MEPAHRTADGGVGRVTPLGLSRPTAHKDHPLTAFTPDAASALDGPDWLRARRVAAATAFADAKLPTTDEEVWRYSRIDQLDLDDWRLPAADEAPVDCTDAGILNSQPIATVSLVASGSGSVRVDMPAELAEQGVWIGPLAESPEGEAALGSVAGEPTDVFGYLNDAFARQPLLVRIPARVRIESPIHVRHSLSVNGVALFPRVVIQAGEGSDATIVEQYTSPEGPLLVVPITEIDVAARARLTHVTVQQLGSQTWQLGSHLSRVGQEATLTAGTVALGGDYARVRTDCRLVGRGATGNLMAVYFGEGNQTLDFRTFQDHAAPDTTSNLLFKGAVGGHSRSIYTGLIKVRKEGRGTNAFQTNRNLKLSDGAWAESVPNLEIENNDVHCSHASAVGPIDEDQRFYLESRGVRPDLAERLVVRGFFQEVIDQMPVEGLNEPVGHLIDEKLDRQVIEHG